MLEHQSLLILPWALAPGVPPGLVRGKAAFLQRRAILDAATATPVGFVCRRRTTGLGRFLWFFRPGPVLEVHESEDEPLLFTVHGRWGLVARWQVRDAEGRPLGKLRMWGHPPAVTFMRLQNGKQVVIMDPDNSEVKLLAYQRSPTLVWEELGKLSRCEDGLRLSFAPGVEGEPFTKMLLLAAVLVTNP